MTGNKCVLDTCVVIHFFKNKASIVKALQNFQEVYLSNIAVGELYYGAYASPNPQKHIDQIQSFLTDCIIIQPGLNSSVIYGQLKAELKRNGTPIPENDIWIAAIAIENDLPLFTTDNHFNLMKVDLVAIDP